MKTIFTSLLLSLFILSGSGVAYADRHDGVGKGERQEQKDRSRNKKQDKRRSGMDLHKDSKMKNEPRHPVPAPRRASPAPRHKTPAPPLPAPRGYAPVPPPPPERLGHMVSYATRGCKDVNVWQIDHDTYIVRYCRGGRYYTRYIYPYIGRYGERSQVSINWQPMSPWLFIPPIQLNINL